MSILRISQTIYVNDGDRLIAFYRNKVSEIFYKPEINIPIAHSISLRLHIIA